MLGAGQAVVLGAGAPVTAGTYNNLVDALEPISHWPLGGLADRKGVSPITAFGSHETGLPPIAQLDASGNARGFNGIDAYGTIAHDAAYQVTAGGVFVLMQPDQVTTKVQVFNSGVTAPGSMALEVDANGQPRAYRHRSDGTGIAVAGSAGQIVAGTPYLYGVTWGPNGLRLWLLDEDLQPGLVASDPETDWATITDTATKYLGRWSGSAIDHFDGVLGHLQFYGSELSLAQVQSLALPQQVVWLDDIAAGSVEASGSTTIDLAPYAHPETGFTPAVLSQGALGTASVSGENFQYAAGAIEGDDTFTGKIAYAGHDSPTASVTIEVVEELQASYTVPVAPTVPSESAIYLARSSMGGNDSNPGTLASPKLTPAGAFAAVSSGGQIVVRKGTHRGWENLDWSSKTNLTLKGYRPDIEVDPLNPDNWPIIDGSFEGVTWEVFNAGRNEYRTVSTGHGSGIAHGFAVAGTAEASPYQISRYAPVAESGEGGILQPTRPMLLYSYRGTTGPRSAAAFRQRGTASSSHNDETYQGPGVYRDSDNRIYISLDPVDSSFYGETPPDEFTNKNPANNQIFLWQDGRTLFSSIGAGLTLEGLFMRGYDRIFGGDPPDDFHIDRCVWWSGHFQFGGLLFSSGCDGFEINHCVVEGGTPDHSSWRVVKNVTENGGSNWGRTNLVHIQSGALITNAILRNSLFLDFFDVFEAPGLAVGSSFKILNCGIIDRDDLAQVPRHVGEIEIAYNFIIGPAEGSGDNSSGTPLQLDFEYHKHHNLIVGTRLNVYGPTTRRAQPLLNWHGTHSGIKIFGYNNTCIGAYPDSIDRGLGMKRPRDSADATPPNQTYNDIHIVYVQKPPNETAPASMFMELDIAPIDPNWVWKMQNCGFWIVKGAGVSAPNRLWTRVMTTSGGSFNTDFASLAAFQAHAVYDNSNGLWGISGRFSEGCIEQDPQFENPDSITLDPRGRPASDFKPTNNAYRNGKNISSTGWPSSGDLYIGALDPDGDGSEIGPQPAE